METRNTLLNKVLRFIAFIVLILLVAHGAPVEDLVTSLPGQPPVSFKQYAGYVTIPEHKALFYYFVEAEHNATRKPLALWLNGGPGCSSLGGGAFTELGPFYPDPQSNGLIRNSKAWNKASNILFVDSPIGVGWSYSNISSNYQDFDDEKTSKDLVHFLRGWFTKFPEYRHRHFYITGESYAGHYGPQLAARLLDFNKKNGVPYFNLKGLLVGNPALNNTMDSQATYEYLMMHGIISEKTYRGLIDNCNWDLPNEQQNELCKSYSDDYELQVEDVNEYDVLVDVCSPEAVQQGFELKRKRRFLPGSIVLDVCISYERTHYFRRPEVQAALHANTTGLNYLWTNCNAGPLDYDEKSILIDMISVLKSLIQQGLRVQLFSGDADSVVPFSGTRRIVNLLADKLNLTTTVPHSAWYSNQQVAGWTQAHEGLSFATVRSAGHMVPYATPARSLLLFKSFVQGRHLPGKDAAK